MDSQTIRTALGKLQAEPGSKEAWESLQSSVKQAGGDLSPEELARLLDSAREKRQQPDRDQGECYMQPTPRRARCRHAASATNVNARS